MAKVRSASVLIPDAAVIDSLRSQGIAFRGPFCLPGNRAFFVIENSILLESELVDLLAQNKLDRDGILELAKRIGTGAKH
jgi:hypothetical protein